MKDPKPLDEHLARLVHAERDAMDLPPGAESRAWERLERAVGGRASGAADGGGAGRGLGSGIDSPVEYARPSGAWVRQPRFSRAWIATALLGVFGLGVAAGVFGSRYFAKERIVYRDRPALGESAAGAAAATGAGKTQPAGEPASSGPPPVLFEIPLDAKSANPSSAPASRQLAEERALLDIARAALNREQGEEALHATERHKTRFPSGMLGEEREALAIQALLVLSRRDEAVRRASRFEQRYPHSVLLPTVRAAVSGSP